MTFSDEAYAHCARIPKGRVSTYKEIARAMGSQAYQAVGQAMRNNPYAPKVPCHRVVASDGSLHGFGGKTSGKKLLDKAQMLRKEGVAVRDGMVVNFDKVFYKLS